MLLPRLEKGKCTTKTRDNIARFSVLLSGVAVETEIDFTKPEKTRGLLSFKF
jgi:hypothetical protein